MWAVGVQQFSREFARSDGEPGFGPTFFNQLVYSSDEAESVVKAKNTKVADAWANKILPRPMWLALEVIFYPDEQFTLNGQIYRFVSAGDFQVSASVNNGRPRLFGILEWLDMRSRARWETERAIV